MWKSIKFVKCGNREKYFSFKNYRPIALIVFMKNSSSVVLTGAAVVKIHLKVKQNEKSLLFYHFNVVIAVHQNSAFIVNKFIGWICCMLAILWHTDFLLFEWNELDGKEISFGNLHIPGCYSTDYHLLLVFLGFVITL